MAKSPLHALTCAPIVPTAAAFSLDLVEASRQHVRFLQRVHSAGISLRAPTAAEFRRYEQLWLPLLKVAPKDTVLVPPLDIAWLWHCHRLAPVSYARACVDIFGAKQSLDCPKSAFQAADAMGIDRGVDTAALEMTQAIWNRMYPDEPFFLDADIILADTGEPRVYNPATSTDNGGIGRSYGVIAGFDVVESCERQASFLWQVTAPRFSDPAFLREGVLNYACFLKLMQLHPTAFLVPTYQIDLMWHTHMLASSAAYHRDAGALTGQPAGPDHDDSVNDRSHAKTKLNLSTRTTKELWKLAFGQDYFCPGGMFRGEPPREYWHRTWQPMPFVSGSDATAGSVKVAFQQPSNVGSRLLEALCTGTEFHGVDDSRYIYKKGDRVVGGAPPDGAITDATIAEAQSAHAQAPQASFGPEKVPSASGTKYDTVLTQGSVVHSNHRSEEQIYGCDLTWLKSIPPFVQPAPKSTTRDNANPQCVGYVFGAASDDLVGYWRLDTTQADTIIVRKLDGRLKTLEKDADERERTLDYVRAEV